jgi:multiple sugar transport system ATP-binding protein
MVGHNLPYLAAHCERAFAAPPSVGAFIGSPPMNLVEATLQEGRIRFADFQVPIGEDHPKEIDGGDSFILGIRPSDIADADIHADGSLPVVEIDVEVTEELGSEVNVLFTIDAPPVTIELVEATFEEGKTEEAIPMLGSDTSVFCARVDARTKAAAGRRARLALDPARFHFFDLETGVALRAD